MIDNEKNYNIYYDLYKLNFKTNCGGKINDLELVTWAICDVMVDYTWIYIVEENTNDVNNGNHILIWS